MLKSETVTYNLEFHKVVRISWIKTEDGRVLFLRSHKAERQKVSVGIGPTSFGVFKSHKTSAGAKLVRSWLWNTELIIKIPSNAQTQICRVGGTVNRRGSNKEGLRGKAWAWSFSGTSRSQRVLTLCVNGTRAVSAPSQVHNNNNKEMETCFKKILLSGRLWWSKCVTIRACGASEGCHIAVARVRIPLLVAGAAICTGVFSALGART